MPDDLRTAVIKLAHAQPTLRKPLLNILREAAKSPPRDTRKWGKVPNDPWTYTWTDGKTTFTIKRRDQQGNLYYVLMVSSMEKYTDGRLILEGPHEVRGLSENVDYLAADAARLHGKIQAAVNGEDVTFEHLIPGKVATSSHAGSRREAADGSPSSLPTWVEPPSSLTAWDASEDQSSYTWSDGKTAFSINHRDMRGITYYVLLVASNEKFPDGDPILKKTFQHSGQKGRAKDWVDAAQGLYRMIQAAANGEGSVIFNTLIPTKSGEVLKVGSRATM